MTSNLVLSDVTPPFTSEEINETTAQIIQAIQSGECTLLKRKANYRTDRPANLGKPGNTHVRGNSESEVSYPLDLGKICRQVGVESPALCINSLRMYGQISNENPLHFHGYSKPAPGAMEFIIFSIKMICPYDPGTGDIIALRCSRHRQQLESEELAPLVFIYEEDGIIKYIAPEVGDLVVLPSGVFHEFSCLPSTFADLSSIEVASDVSILSGGSWKREQNGDPQQVIAATIAQTGQAVTEERIKALTLADIPFLYPYIETSHSRLDARSVQ